MIYVVCQVKNNTIYGGSKVFMLIRVHPEIVDFGFRQGPSEFSTAGIACYVED